MDFQIGGLIMSDWLVNLIKIEKVEHHPNADALDLIEVYGQTVVSKKGTYKPGDLAIFLPPDSILPQDPNNPIVMDSGLKPGHVIEPKRLRGIFSNGMLIPASVCFTEEQLNTIPVDTHVAKMLGITKWESFGDSLEKNQKLGGPNEKDLGYMPKYTDIEGLPKWKQILEPGEEVVVTLKTHGSNARFCVRDNQLWVGSRNCIKKEYIVDDQEKNVWWELAKKIGLESKLRHLNEVFGHDRTVIYGELYGQVQGGFHYDTDGKTNKLRIFDTYNTLDNKYNDWDETVKIAEILGVEIVSVLYRGPWKEELDALRAGMDPLGKTHVREGFVVKPIKERYDYKLGRVILKRINDDYKLKIKRN